MLREVEVDVWFLQEGAYLVDEGPASVEEDEVGVAEAGVVEERFEEEWVVAGYVEVASAAGGGVDVDGHPKTAALLRNVAEEKVLQAFVLGWIRVRGVEEGGVDAGGFGAGDVVEAEGAEVGDFELFGYGALGFLLFEDWGD